MFGNQVWHRAERPSRPISPPKLACLPPRLAGTRRTLRAFICMDEIERALRGRLERYRELLLNFDDGLVRRALLEKMEEIETRLDELEDDE